VESIEMDARGRFNRAMKKIGDKWKRKEKNGFTWRGKIGSKKK